MTQRRWFIFIGIQLVGCAAATVGIYHYAITEPMLYRWLSAGGSFLLLPGSVLGSALADTVGSYSVCLPAAVALNVGFWLVCHRVGHNIREHMSGIRPHRFAIAFVVVTIVFVLINVVHFMRPPACYDCFLRHGLPLSLYHEGGYAGGASIMWGGLAADMSIVVVTAVLFGSVWNWCAHRRIPE